MAKSSLKKTGKFVGKVLGSAILGTTGTVSALIEQVGDAADNELVSEIAYKAKSASWNTTRKMWGKGEIEFKKEDGSHLRARAENNYEKTILKAQEKIDEIRKSDPDRADILQAQLNTKLNGVEKVVVQEPTPNTNYYDRNKTSDENVATEYHEHANLDSTWIKVKSGNVKDHDASNYDNNGRRTKGDQNVPSYEKVTRDNDFNLTSNIMDIANEARRTDEELANNQIGLELLAEDYLHGKGYSLLDARTEVYYGKPGVYVIWLNGKVMKCGRAVKLGERLGQYYRIAHDKRAQEGNSQTITLSTRDDVVVDFQHCPLSKITELEARLTDRYGKGPWASRNSSWGNKSETWKLLI